MSTIATLDEMDVVITDGGLEPGARRVLERSCRVVIAVTELARSPSNATPSVTPATNGSEEGA